MGKKEDRLLSAITRNDYAIVDKLTRSSFFNMVKGADVNAIGYYKKNGQIIEGQALMLAVTLGYTKISELLIDKGADIYAKDTYNNFPLEEAIKRNYIDMVQMFLEKGASLSGEDFNLIFFALKWDSSTPEGGCHDSMVKLLINNCDNINETDWEKNTLLTLSLDLGRNEIAKLLINMAADVKKKGKYGSPLIIAIKSGYQYIARLLIDKGADVNEDFGHPIFTAAAHGHTNIVRLLVDKGADVNIEVYDATPLMIAAINGHREVVELLIDKGADINTKDKDGKTPMTYALKEGHQEIYELLINKATNGIISDRNNMQKSNSKTKDWINKQISDKELRPLGNKNRLTDTTNKYDAQIFLFKGRNDAKKYYQEFVSYARINPPPFCIEIMFVRIHTIYNEPYGFIFPNDSTDERQEYTNWCREAYLKCNEVTTNFQSMDHSYEVLNQYVKELYDWTILTHSSFDIESSEGKEIFSDPHGGGFKALTVS